jgi:ATP-dependent Clp protease ATP-binding subunit ClpC
VFNLGYHIELTNEAKDYIAEKGYDIQFGARPLKRAIQKYLEDPMAEVIIKADIKEGDKIEVSFDKEKEEIKMGVVHQSAEKIPPEKKRRQSKVKKHRRRKRKKTRKKKKDRNKLLM